MSGISCLQRPAANLAMALMTLTGGGFGISCPTSAAAEMVPAVATPVDVAATAMLPTLFSFSAQEESSFAMRPGDESWGKGGVVVGYENVRLFCDNLHFWKSLVPGMQRELPERGLLAAGPKGQDPLRVVLDSRTSQLPEVAFRGLMKPREVELVRLPPDPTQPGVVRFRITLTGLGDFAGLLHIDQGWEPYAGWAERAVIVVRGDIDAASGGLVRQRFDTLYLYGRPRQDGRPKELTRLLRLKKPLGEDVPAKDVPEADCKAGLEGMTITLYFDNEGRIDHGGAGLNSHQFGTELFGNGQVSEPSKPALIPATP